MHPDTLAWGFLGLTVLIALITRLRLLAIPLERDEGGFAYIGYWLWQGKRLYVDFFDSKLPGLYALYGFFTNVLGYGAVGVHIGLLLANVVAVWTFFLWCEALYDRSRAAIASGFLATLLVSANVMGFAAHATQLLLPFVTGGMLLLWRGFQRGHLWAFLASGLLFGLAVTIKQQAAVFAVLVALLWWPMRLFWEKKEGQRLPLLEWLALGVGGFLPIALIVAYFYTQGRFADLYHWCVEEPLSLASKLTAGVAETLEKRIPQITSGFEGIWLLAVAGLLLLWFERDTRTGSRWAAAGVFVGGIAGAFIGIAFYPHYFVLALPGVALLAAGMVHWIGKKAGTNGLTVSLGLALLCWLWPVLRASDYFFRPDYVKIHRKAYGFNPFPELAQIGKVLSRRTQPGDHIGVLGSEPNLLVAAQRESCTRELYVYNFALPVRPDAKALEDAYFAQLDSCKAEYVVWNVSIGSWGGNYNEFPIFKRINEWLKANYQVVGLADIRDERPGIIVWDEAVRAHQRSKDSYLVLVYKRKDS